MSRNADLSTVPFKWPGGSCDVLLTFSLAVLAFGGFEASAPLAEETRNPRRNVPIAVIGAVLISGVIYVLGSYALVIADPGPHRRRDHLPVRPRQAPPGRPGQRAGPPRRRARRDPGRVRLQALVA